MGIARGQAMGKRILVTGGCGFVGTNLVPLLEQAGHQVRVLDSETLGRREHLDDFGGEFVKGDIRDPDALHDALEGVDAVIHLAADTRVIDSINDPLHNFDVNVVGSFRLLQSMRARRIGRLINASTGGAIIGDVTPPVHEGLVPQPIAPYGASKLAVEGFCSAWSGSYGLRTLSLRFANVYGPRSFHKGSVVASFFKQILRGRPLIIYGDGNQTRDFVFVDDLCRGIVHSLDCDVSSVIQLGSGVPVSVNTLIDLIRPLVAPLPVRVEYREARQGEIAHTWCDITRARSLLGFDPATPLAQGLAQTWEWFCSRSDSLPFKSELKRYNVAAL
ncbi:NAD-dependent epimerase/dehydratase family protein [Novosphingobium rhizosphaerae]|uniref:NAD-dependent epimerase/dehydratase family protein n=1 Tax=Novosphingobium rhizosphaerae TaxID=1551649 RepID=UPI003D814342